MTRAAKIYFWILFALNGWIAVAVFTRSGGLFTEIARAISVAQILAGAVILLALHSEGQRRLERAGRMLTCGWIAVGIVALGFALVMAGRLPVPLGRAILGVTIYNILPGFLGWRALGARLK